MGDSSRRFGKSERSLHGDMQPHFGEVLIRQRGRLPHWEKEAGLYFVTFHLADSLPHQASARIIERHRVLEAANQMGASLSPAQRVLVARYSPKQIEEYFDRGFGSCYLRNPQIGELVVNALYFWHGKRYRLVAWCVMPNRVHVIFRLLPGHALPDVVRSWKSFTARAANRILGRAGTFWQREYYDRLIRKDGELERAIRYVLDNPKRAGLTGWKWVWTAGHEARATAGLETGATH